VIALTVDLWRGDISGTLHSAQQIQQLRRVDEFDRLASSECHRVRSEASCRDDLRRGCSAVREDAIDLSHRPAQAQACRSIVCTVLRSTRCHDEESNPRRRPRHRQAFLPRDTLAADRLRPADLQTASTKAPVMIRGRSAVQARAPFSTHATQRSRRAPADRN
jgi:hypothetical protein